MLKLTPLRKSVQRVSRLPLRMVQRESKPAGRATALHPLLRFQQMVGNQAIGRLIQAKLNMGQPEDQYEREADRVEAAVVCMPEPRLSVGAAVSRWSQDVRIQRVCSGCAEELRRQPLEEEDETLQMKEDSSELSEVSSSMEVRLDAIRGSGQPLPKPVRAFFEPIFGYDFSHVRIHTDAGAAESARAVNARAFTVGRDIVFGAGEYTSATAAGRRLLGHELTHEVQQGSGAHHSTIQRDEGKPKETEEGPVESARKEALQAVSEIETNWKMISTSASSFSELNQWIQYGDTTATLIRDHTNAALEALQKRDTNLYNLYVKVVESDKTMYDFIAWHTSVYINLLDLRSDVEDLIDLFDNDDRELTGRDKMEEEVNALQELIDVFPEQAEKLVQQVSVNEIIKVKRGNAIEVTIVATNAFTTSKFFLEQTENIIKLDSAIKVILGEVNKFLLNAQKEGALQAIDAIQQFLSLRGGSKGKGPKASRGKQKRQKKEKKPDERKKKEKDKKKRQAAMRFQVQWGTGQGGPTFGLPAVAPWETGVTTTQAVATLGAVVATVRPDEAREAAAPAAAKQLKWILSRPPAGIATGGVSNSEYFAYRRYTDPRVDVENLRGHNLRR